MKISRDRVLLDRINDHMKMRRSARDELPGTIKVKLEHLEHLHFRGTASEGRGLSLDIDESPERGGQGNGVTPLETFLMGAGSCSLTQWAALIISEGLKVDTLNATVTGQIDRRVEGLFRSLTFDIMLTGSESVERIRGASGDAEGLCRTAEGLCYVHNTLRRAVPIHTNVYMNGNLIYSD
ncbi:MAG: OsmC family protein [Nitrososphaerota archaeon]|nr:OsmC family protein [Nitrososphaerota archaeon]